jgi:hypothetical protein
MDVGTATNTSGAGVTIRTTGTANASFGLLSVSDIAGGLTCWFDSNCNINFKWCISSLTQGPLQSGTPDAKNYAVFSVTGGTLSGATDTATPTVAYNSTLTAAAVFHHQPQELEQLIQVSQMLAQQQLTVPTYNGSTATFASAAAAAASPTSGTLRMAKST